MIRLSSWGHFSGQNDVQPALHVPVVYESIAVSPAQWEYYILNIDPREEALPDEARLTELGKQGWLLVSVLEPRQAAPHSPVQYYFVRQKVA